LSPLRRRQPLVGRGTPATPPFPNEVPVTMMIPLRLPFVGSLSSVHGHGIRAPQYRPPRPSPSTAVPQITPRPSLSPPSNAHRRLDRYCSSSSSVRSSAQG
jgi:hypothetical protein